MMLSVEETSALRHILSVLAQNSMLEQELQQHISDLCGMMQMPNEMMEEATSSFRTAWAATAGNGIGVQNNVLPQ